MEPVAVVPVIRLFLLNEGSGFVGDAGELARADVRKDLRSVRWLPLAVLVADDRKHQPLLHLRRQGQIGPTFGERVNRVIERGTEIVDGIADQDADAGWRGLIDLRPSNCVARLGVYLSADGVSICLKPEIDRFLRSFYVFSSPFELQPRAL
jgi:hypothetical protein